MVINKISMEEQSGSIKLSQKEKLLKYLMENKNPQSIMTASGAIVLDYKNTYNLVNELQPDIILKEKIGNTSLISLKLNPNLEIFSVEEKRKKQFLQYNKKLNLVEEDIKSLDYPFFVVLVFGSLIKKTGNKDSDIDLCIISDNKEKTKELISKFNLLPLPLEIHDFSFDEFKSMLKTKEKNIVHEIIKNNIILYGIENYYNLISKWMKKD
jgi:predicted nucleotidyltransferase